MKIIKNFTTNVFKLVDKCTVKKNYTKLYNNALFCQHSYNFCHHLC